jgi:hypothetical protein
MRIVLGQLRQSGAAVPQWTGLPNKLQIARACGFDRSVFDTEPSLGDCSEVCCAVDRLRGRCAMRKRAAQGKRYVIETVRCLQLVCS